jgi:predicted Zn-dependent peptidase
MSRTRLLAAVLALAAGAGCPAQTTEKKPVSPDDQRALDERPTLGAPKPYRAADPVIYQTPEGLTVWLVERPETPMVSMAFVLPRGAADDPVGKAGLAHITASMLDEGAGSRGALEISSSINDLGAQLDTSVDRDGSRVSLTVLKKYLPQAFEIFSDIIARPRFDPAEWKRVSDLWKQQLRRRADSPQAVAMVVSTSVLYGSDTPQC